MRTRSGLGMAVVLGVVVFYKIVFSGQQAFGETMMFMYYGYLIPMSQRIRRGFYADGIWLDAGELEALEKHEEDRPGILGRVVTDIFKGLGRGTHKVG